MKIVIISESERELLVQQGRQKDRLMEIIGRHVLASDKNHSDRELVMRVFERYQRYLREHLGDPSE